MLSHIFTHWKTSAAGLLLAIVTVAGVFSQQGVTLGTAGTGTVIALIAAVGTALLGLIARDPGTGASSGTSASIVIALLSLGLLAAAPVRAQSGLTFTTGSEATALHFNNAWSAASHSTETLDLVDFGANKANSLSIQGHEILSPAFNAYLGGVQLVPNISALLGKTNIPASSFTIFLQGAGGVSPSGSTSNLTWLAGGGANYQITSSLSWQTVDAHVGSVGSQSFVEVSSGISWLFNPQSSNAPQVKTKYRAKIQQLFNAVARQQK